jgi:uncharacterized protein DUF4190
METGSNPPEQPSADQPSSPQSPAGGAPTPPPPAAPPAAAAPGQAPQAYGRTDGGNTPAVIALILGIVGIIMIPLAAPFAWWQGVVGKRRVDDGLTAENRGMAVAGQVLGIIGTALLAIYVLIFVIVIIVAIATS